jgi:FtsP/CotA-like multicopper oxidase with cupredoxin domain
MPAGAEQRDAQPDGGGILTAVSVVAAVMALAIAIVAVVVAGGSGGSSSVTAGAQAEVTLTEFAIEPAAVSVAEGGTLLVSNGGATAHDVSVVGTDLTTGEVAAGAQTELDVSSLAAGDYEIFCSIPGHADAGMRGTLTVGGTDVATGSDHGGAHGQLTPEQYQQMSEAMNATIADFPAETAGVGNPLLEPVVLPDGTKQFELEAAVTPWEVEPGKTVDAWTYNGIVPGPMIRVDVGDRVQIVVHNELPMGTDLHLHGINVPNNMDGVAPLTQPLIEPGQSFTYEFVADEVAVGMFHAHHHGQMQVPNGLLGTIFVGELPLPRGRTIGGQPVPADLVVAQEFPMVLNDSGVIGYSLNGKSFPATAPIAGHLGDWILIHYFNEGSQIHPMHLHQFDQIVVAKDGFPLDEPYVTDTLNVAPGERYSVLVQLESPGAWVWHCHILNHVERDTGMYGMVTAIIVE